MPARLLCSESIRTTVFSRLLSGMPYYTRCSHDKTAVLSRPRHLARLYPYTQVNNIATASWLVIDLDYDTRSGLGYPWEAGGLPVPNLMVRDPASGTAHLFYAIVPVCTSAKGRPGPVQFMRGVRKRLSERLGGDPSYAGPVAKTPGHPWWETVVFHNHEYDLPEIRDYLGDDAEDDRPWLWGPTDHQLTQPHSRHCLLFDHLRFFAYRIVGDYRGVSFEAFSRRLQERADTLNTFRSRGFSHDLSGAQVRATVKSVATWTYYRYRGGGKAVNRGVMALSDTLPLQARQHAAAQRTAVVRKQQTRQRLIACVRQLEQAGDPVTPARLALASGLSRRTVYRHRGAWDSSLGTTDSPKPANSPDVPVFAQAQPPLAAATKTPSVCDIRCPSDNYWRSQSLLNGKITEALPSQSERHSVVVSIKCCNGESGNAGADPPDR